MLITPRHRWCSRGAAVMLASLALALPFFASPASAVGPPPPSPPTVDASVCPPLSDPCPYDVTRPAWFAGFQVQQFAQIPAPFGSGPPAPSPERRDVTVYLVGNVGQPFSPEQRIPNGPVIPAHDDVWSRYPFAIIDGFGQWVVPGPGATAATVRTRPQPDGSIVGAPLAYAIKIGRHWQNLTSGLAVSYGLRTGQLDLVDAGYGGGGWFILQKEGRS